jgi:hypothetical protein
MRILDDFYDARPATPIYHYTDANGMLAILETKNLRGTHIQFLNDSSEFHHALEMIATSLTERIAQTDSRNTIQLLTTLARGLKIITPNTFVISFSEKRDLLSQWRGYCPNGGYNIEFSSDSLSQLANKNEYRFVRCEYDKLKQKYLVDALVEAAIEYYPSFVPDWGHTSPVELNSQEKFDLFAAGWFWNKTQLLASAIKNDSFIEESEWRLIGGLKGKKIADGYRTKGCLIVPYKNFDLTLKQGLEEVVTGATISPMSNPLLAEHSLWRVWHASNRSVFHIRPSTIPYRTLG